MRNKNVLTLAACLAAGALCARAGSVTWDFNTDPTTGEHPLILLGSGNGGGDWIQYDGANGASDGFLSITGPTTSLWSKIIFPDIDNGNTVAAFTFECRLRIGNGSDVPADGFSINYARASDPTFTKTSTGNYQSGGWSGTVSEPGSTPNNPLAGLPEEGTITGLAIGFDAYPSGNAALWPADLNAGINDLIGISVRVDNKVIAQVAMPAINTTCEDPASLQTGPISAAGASDWTTLCWQPFKVQLTVDKHLSVWWKGRAVVDNLAVDFAPSAGRLVFGGRTGGLFQNQQIDEISLTTTAAAQALVGAVSADPVGVTAQLEDAGASTVAPNTVVMTIAGSPVAPLAIGKAGKITTVRWTSPALIPAGTDLTVTVTFQDAQGVTITGTRTVKVAGYDAMIPASCRVPTASVDKGKPGFLVRPYQTDARQPNALNWTEEQLLGLHGANTADLSMASGGFYVRETVLNFNNAAPDAVGNFTSVNGYPDDLFPGFPGATGLNGSTAEEVLTYLEFPTAGLYQLGVNSDDGFRVTAGRDPADLLGVILGYFDGGRGSSDTLFTVLVPEAGFYPIRLIWENGAGELPGNGANLEFFSVKDGVKTLVNDTSADAIRAYRESATAAGPYISALTPVRGATSVPGNAAIVAKISQGPVPVDAGSVIVKLNGTVTPATVVPAGTITTVTVLPPGGLLPPNAVAGIQIEYRDSNTPPTTHTAEWQFAVGSYEMYQGPYGEGNTWNVYAVYRGAKQWVDAEMAAMVLVEPFSGLNKPGHLVTLRSADEANYVRTIANGPGVFSGSGESVWIGLTDDEGYGGEEVGSDAASGSMVPPGSGKWVWVTGEPYTFARWNGGEPNDWENGNPGEDAVELYNNGLFNDNGDGILFEPAPTRAYVVEYETRLAGKLPGVAEMPPSFMPPDLPGVVAGDAGSWNIRVYRNCGFSNCGILEPISVILQNRGDITDATAYVVNFWDPESGICDTGNMLYGSKAPFPGDIVGAAEDWFVMLAKTTISVPEAGDYTFGVQSDDSFSLRVHGGRFVSSSGNGTIEPQDPSVLYFNAGTCNSSTRGVCRFPAAGQYVIELVYYECTGNTDIELYWAKGAFVSNSDTTTWKLVGNPAGVPATLPADPLPGPGCCENQFGIRVVRNVGNIGNINDAVAAFGNPNATVVDTFAPVINFNDLDGGQGNSGLFPGDVGFPGNLPGDDNNFALVAKGRIKITQAGAYTFGVHSDDGFALRIRGQVWVSKAGGAAIDVADPSTLVFAGGTGDSDSRAVVNLAVGEYDLEFLFFENGGGASAELYAAKGAILCDAETTDWRLVNYKLHTPPETRQLLGVSTAGWTVEYSAPGGANLNSIADAENELLDSVSVANVPKVQYLDPQVPGGAQACSVPFPQDTPADDDDFAIRATADLIIPVAGTYQFGFQGDDGGYLQIEGQAWDGIVATTDANIGSINGDRIQFDANTGDSRTVGAITLQPGTYTIRALFWERGGGAYFWVFGGDASGRLSVLMNNGSVDMPYTDGLPLACVAPCPAQFTRITANTDGTVTVEWAGGGTLQYTGSLTPPAVWVDAAGATSPFTFAPPTQPLFGRIKK